MSSETFSDRIYGHIQFSDPVIADLINSPSLQRLKGVDQAGYFEPHFPGTSQTRFEHSLGVCWLLRRYGAPLEEQAAGLIHDVSHTAFSHCIDYVLSEGSQSEHSYQDDSFEGFVRESEIPAILEKYGLSLKYILDEENFPLKETELPDLCADRIDYSLRTAVAQRELTPAEALALLDQLQVHERKWVFAAYGPARQFAELFLNLNRKYYAGFPSAAMFRTVGDCLAYALERQYVSRSDLYTTDEQVLGKIENHLESDARLALLFRRMNLKSCVSEARERFDAIVTCKSRIVDPLCLHHSSTARVSEIDSSWGEIVQDELKPKVYRLRFAD